MDKKYIEGRQYDPVQAAAEAALEADRIKSLRDAFAGGALSAIIAHEGVREDWRQKRQVRDAYEYADLMMKARVGQL